MYYNTMHTCSRQQKHTSHQHTLCHSVSTWMSSSLVSNSDTRTFFPSGTLVTETLSFPEARTWASSGNILSMDSFTICSRLNAGFSGPSLCFLACLAMDIKSAQISSTWTRTQLLDGTFLQSSLIIMNQKWFRIRIRIIVTLRAPCSRTPRDDTRSGQDPFDCYFHYFSEKEIYEKSKSWNMDM